MSIKSESKEKKLTTNSFTTALSTYYKLKGEYNAKINKSVKQIYNSDLTSQQKSDKFNQLSKQCIVCGKSGGTIFEQDNNMLLAKCGNAQNPCKLDIKIQKAKYNNIIDSLNNETKQINNYKNKIITTKLNFLFGFTNQEDTLNEFNELKNNLVKLVKLYQEHSNKYTNTIYNTNNIDLIDNLHTRLNSNINIFKDNIENFNETGEIAYLKDAVELYVNTIKIINKDINDAKYKINEIYKDENTEMIYLIQKNYILSDLLIIEPGTENKVISFSL